MNTYFTADTHFHHANILKYCNRPFQSAEDMDEALIRNWNELVGVTDEVYHLGDFSFESPERYLYRLNGHILFVFGNHDKRMLPLRDRWREWKHKITFLPAEVDVVVQDQQLVLSHYAHRVWNKSHRGTWHLYGHSHGTLPDDPNARSMDVGVDTNNYRPYTFQEVKAHMAKKTWKPIDHHGS